MTHIAFVSEELEEWGDLSDTQCVFVSVEPEEWEDFDGDDDVVDLRAYAVLGGVFHFNLLHLPPQPKVVKDWTITQGNPIVIFVTLADIGDFFNSQFAKNVLNVIIKFYGAL